jgi:predicted dehydrogenase
MTAAKLRVGILGAARIAPMALLRPARSVDEIEIACVAARDRARARAFARKHGIPRVASSYEELLADPAIDAIYNPLPNALHAAWTIRALEAGKHVLCEKPFTANEAEARRVADVAARTGKVAMEAFHWRYHPLAARMLAVVASGELGAVRRIETWMCIPLPLPGDIRYRLDLAGGAMMDTGSYTVSMLRHLAGAEPTVEQAEARLSSPGVDRWMRASLRFDDGREGALTCSLWSFDLLKIRARVEGELGTMDALNPAAPQIYHRLTVTTRAGRRREKVPGEPSYTCQLRAFAGAALRGEPIATGAEDAVKNMRVIDAVYRAAGLPIRADQTVENTFK